MTEPTATAPASGRSRGADILLTMASLVVVCAGISAASSIVVPVLAAVFVTAVALPPIVALRTRGAPAWLAVAIVLAVVASVVLLAGMVLARTAASFGENFNEYRATLQSQVAQLEAALAARGMDISGEHLGELLDAGRLLSLVKGMLAGVIGVLRDGVFVVVMVGFLLAEAAGLPAKVKLAFRVDDATLGPWRRILDDMTGYLVVKTKTSLLTAALVTVAMWMLGVDYPLALGLLAFILNFVPVVGSIIAAVPAVLLALIASGPVFAAVVTAVYVAVNMSIGSILEPRMMGERLGLSALVVFLSLVFWGFLLGPVGMFLSVPLTMLAKILLNNADDLRWLAIMLGPAPPAAKGAAGRGART
ncbi:MAG: AI-2E family transporter [Phycisphaerales bacterium]|nr:AI-2E family transporter [Phycisphaerales bacterium]